MENHMNWREVEADWDHYKKRVKGKWDKLTDADMDQIHGDRHRLMQALQERYSLPKEKAEEQLDQFLDEAENWISEAKEKVIQAAQCSGQYLMEKSINDMANDLQSVIRKNPIRCTLISLGVGYCLGRMLTSSRS